MPAARPVVHRPLAVGAHARGEEGRALGNKLAAEFIGTFFLVFTVGAATAKAGAGVLAPLAIGAVLMAMVFAGGHVSGAHYNPAVTAAIMMRGKIKPGEALAYVIAQVTAAALAGLLARAIDGGTSAPAPAGLGKVLAVEFLFTFALAYVVLNVATSAGTRDNSYYGLAIGFTVVAGALAVGGISGGAFNPAVVVGGSIIGLLQWGNFWIYLFAELAGGIAAAFVFLRVGGDATESRRAHLAGDGV
jgi:aquaporin Z